MPKSKDVGRMISIVSNQIKRQFDENVALSAITGVQGRFLHFILARSANEEVFQKDLEEEFNLRRSTATGILQLMEKNNLLYRESVEYDARLKKIIVTEKGAQMKDQVEKSLQWLEQKIRRDISAEDLEIFFRIIDKMSKNLE